MVCGAASPDGIAPSFPINHRDMGNGIGDYSTMGRECFPLLRALAWTRKCVGSASARAASRRLATGRDLPARGVDRTTCPEARATWTTSHPTSVECARDRRSRLLSLDDITGKRWTHVRGRDRCGDVQHSETLTTLCIQGLWRQRVGAAVHGHRPDNRGGRAHAAIARLDDEAGRLSLCREPEFRARWVAAKFPRAGPKVAMLKG
jgi:hypothetical protein